MGKTEPGRAAVSTHPLSEIFTVSFGEVAVAANTAVIDQYKAQGVRFGTNGAGTWRTAGPNGPYSSGYGHFGGNYLDNFSGYSGAASVYSILFTRDVAGAGAWFEFNASTNTTFTSYLDGVAQESFVYTNVACCNSASFLGFKGRFDEIRLSNIGGINFIMDNVAFTASEVPEPSSIALLSLSLLAMAGIKRRRG